MRSFDDVLGLISFDDEMISELNAAAKLLDATSASHPAALQVDRKYIVPTNSIDPPT